MAEQLKLSVPADFNVTELGKKLSQKYEKEGYNVDFDSEDEYSFSLQIDKNMSGFMRWVAGLAKKITVNVDLEGTKLNISYTNPEWAGKIVAIIPLGLLWVPFFTGLVGLFGQINFPTKISDDIKQITREMNRRQREAKQQQEQNQA